MAKADDLTITNPKDISQSYFAPGTKWTSAGWTRSNNANIAKRSEYTLGIDLHGSTFNSTISETGSAGFHYIGAKGSFTIDKNQVKKDNTILLASLQSANSWYDNDTNNNKQTITDFGDANLQGNANDVYFQGEKIGYVEYQRQDNAEIDLVLHITTNKNFTTDPEFTLTQPHALIINCWTDKAFFHDLRQKKKIELYQITPTQVQKTIFKYGEPGVSYSKVDYSYPYNDPNGVWVGYGDADNDRTVPKPYHKEFKINSNLNINQDFTPIDATLNTPQRFVRDANNQVVLGEAEYHIIGNCQIKYLENNLNLSDVRKQALNNGVTISKQDDGSVIVVENLDYNAWKDTFKDNWENMQRDLKANSYFYNVVQNSSDQQEAIIKNTNKFMEQRGYVPSERMMWLHFTPKDRTKPFIMNITNLQDGSSYSQSFTPNGSTFNAELYKSVNVRYIDDNTGKTVSSDSMLGEQNKVSQYKVNIPKGYVLSKTQPTSSAYTWSDDKTNINYTFNNDQKVNDANPIIIHLIHEQKQVNGQEEAKRTIKYVYGSDDQGTTAHPDVPQSVTFSGTQDSVTGKLSDLKPSGQWDQVVSPDIKGYTPDLKVVQSETPNPNDNKTVYVHYLANNEKAKLRVIDDHTGLELNGYDEEANGKYDTAISFDKNPNDVAKELENKGYKVVSNSWQDGSKYQDGKNEFAIHVDHTTSTQTENHAQTRTIHYVDGKGNKMSDDVVQKANFTRTGTKDNVTGQIDWKDWTTTDKYAEVSSPAHDGYTPDKAKVDDVTPLYGQNQDQTVVYHRNGQGAEITYVDDTTGKVLKHEQAQGKYNDKIVFNSNVSDTIKGYEDQGYVLVSNDFKNQNYSSDNTANKFTVHFKHGTKQVTRDKNVSQDIDYQIKENGTTHSVNHYKAPDLKFTQSGVQDNVTKETNWNGTVADQQFKAVNTPTIKGYTPDIKQVPTTNIHVDSKN